MRQVDHQQRQIGDVSHRRPAGIHKFFQSPELLGIPEVELGLESAAVILLHMLRKQFQITAEKDDVCPDLGAEVRFDDDTVVERPGEIGVQELRLVGAGLDVAFSTGSLEILFRDVLVIHPSPYLQCGPLPL